MFEFQSLKRDADLGDRVRFHNFSFSTNDAETAEFVRRNCAKNPHLYWEINPETFAAPEKVEETPTAQVVIPKRKPGRPRALAVAGMRTNSTE